jgi:hypothetical protein
MLLLQKESEEAKMGEREEKLKMMERERKNYIVLTVHHNIH